MSLDRALAPLASGLSDVEVPAEWSALPRKRLLYALDTHFREGRWAVEPIVDLVWQLTFVAFKPDAVMGRRIRRCLERLMEHGFTPVAAEMFTYDRLMIRETWRYQFNQATRDRVAVVDALLTASPSLFVVLRDEHANATHPAAVRLASLKGPAQPSRRRPGDLRYELGVVTGLFNFIHTADEPADLVRELSVLLDSDARRRVIADVAAGGAGPQSAIAQIDELERRHPPHDLDASESRVRLAQLADSDVRDAIARAEGGDPGAWEVLLRVIPRAHLWDALSLAAASISVNVKGIDPIIPGLSGT